MKIEFGFAFSKNKFPFNIFALLINWLQKIDASHTFMAYYGETGSKRYYDATFWKVKSLPKYKFLKSYDIRRTYYFTIPEERRIEILKWMESNEGRGYSTGQIFGLLIKILGFSKKSIWRGNPTNVICNEILVLFIRDVMSVKISKNENDYDLDETQALLDDLVYRGLLYRGEI